MAGATSNITTQWTFRDGRDYVLSLNTTATPNTVSFWISDKITGEEWTGCYDENAIELITKRTGCFKSFQTFLSMIKSAMLKKSESVVLDLLNLEDLTAISVHRQTSSLSHSSGSSGSNGHILSMPLNFQLYNGDINGNPTYIGSRHIKPHRADASGSSSSKAASSMLNKRKYLIISYIAEFDKVHYPLPLNYSCPPDLSVMQENIVKLKAEVTSLKNTNKELVSQIEVLRGSTGMSQNSGGGRVGSHCKIGIKTSHENNIRVSGSKPWMTDSSSTDLQTACDNTSQTLDKQKRDENNNNDNENDAANPNSEPTTPGKSNNDGTDDIDDDKKDNPSAAAINCTCTKCTGAIDELRAKIRELEDCISFQRDRHLQSMEKLENENHFLRHKVEAAEKYEMELWNQIQHLKEKVAEVEEKGRKREADARKECSRRDQCHQSRHDMFYNSRYTSVPFYKRIGAGKSASPVGCSSNKNKANNDITLMDKTSNDFYPRRSCLRNSNKIARSRSNSSTASYRSIETKLVRKNSKEVITGLRFCYKSQKGRYEGDDDGSRSSSRSNSLTNFNELNSKCKSLSPSPSRRFDPTAYVTEKKMKQSKIANLRMQKIETRINRSRSNTRVSALQRKRSTEASPARESRNPRSLSAGNDDLNQRELKFGALEMISVTTDCNGDSKKYKLSSLKTPENGAGARSRSSSASGSGRTRTISTTRPGLLIRHSSRREGLRRPTISSNNKVRNTGKSVDAKTPFNSKDLEREQHILRTKANTAVNINVRRSKSPLRRFGKGSSMSRAKNDSIGTALELPLFGTRDERSKKPIDNLQQNEQNSEDISSIQSKLAALQVFLETCKPKPLAYSTLTI